MKSVFTYFTALTMLLLLSNCKKDKTPGQEENSPKSSELSLATASVASIGVETLYGSPSTSGLVDGSGLSAKFNSPKGLWLLPDGTIYVADTNNDAIRKISVNGYVSTVDIKAPRPGGFKKPVFIGVEHGSGTFHFVLDQEDNGDAYNVSWIAKSNGDFVTAYGQPYVSASAMARDPYTDIFYYSSGSGITQHINQSGEIYGEPIHYNRSKLLDEDANDQATRGFSWDALAIGYNKVVYFSTNGNIYKYTPGGETALISNSYGFNRLTSMVLNKDSRTMYVVDNGYIKRIDNKKVTVLAGPNTPQNSGVYAFGLALAKGENTLYFTDWVKHTVCKLYLK